MPYPSEYIKNGMKLIDALYQSMKDGDITRGERYDIVIAIEHDLITSRKINPNEGLFDWSEQENRTITEVYCPVRKAEQHILQNG